MRNSSNISMPHPVLGNSNDIEGSFSINIVGNIKDNELNIKGHDLVIKNEYFKGLIDSKKACVAYNITCNSTLYSTCVFGDLDETIKCNLISNNLSLKVFIISLVNIDDYSDDSFHEDTKLGGNKGVFNVPKGSPIGDAGGFSIALTDEYRKGLSGIIDWYEGELDEPISIDVDGNKIKITFPHSSDNQNMVTTFTSGKKKYVNVFLNLFLIPALTEAFDFLIEKVKTNAYDQIIEDYDWARVVHQNIDEPIVESDFAYGLAQTFLKKMTEKKTQTAEALPILNAFNELYK